MKKVIIAGILSLTAVTVKAQDSDRLYSQLAYKEAIKEYLDELKSNPNDGAAMYNLATAHRLNNETGEAQKWYERAVKYSGNKDAAFYYAQMLLMNGRTTQAKQWFRNYQSTVVGDEAAWLESYLELCDNVSSGKVRAKNFEVLPVVFNSKDLDFSPMYINNDLAFVSNRDERRGSKMYSDAWTDDGYTDIFVTNEASGYTVHPLSRKLNTTLHEGSGVFDEQNGVFYYTANNVQKYKQRIDDESNVRLQIYAALQVDSTWQKGEKLNFNRDAYSYCHPAVSKDGQTMIFASDQPGGYGGMDLWMVKKEGDHWSTPKNLGERVNTPGNEVFPFLESDGSLYFASNYHPGYGGLDVFKSQMGSQVWSIPENLGVPLNSSKDDFGLITKNQLQTGYLSSNRGGGDDIYAFTFKGSEWMEVSVINCLTGEPIANAEVNVKVGDQRLYQLESNERGMVQFKPINGYTSYVVTASSPEYSNSEDCPGFASVSVQQPGSVILGLQQGDPLPLANTGLNLCGTVINGECNYLLSNTEVTIIDLCEGKEYKVRSNDQGKFDFPLKKDCKYRIEIQREYFDPVVTMFETNEEMSDCYEMDVKLNSNVDLRDPANGFDGGDQILLTSGAVIELYNVYFDLDKFNIRRDAEKELNWVKNILASNPDIVVEIGAHTDARATDEYNDELSENRARSVRKWLIKNGIDASRLKFKGYGETELKNDCGNGVDCSDVEHQRNRRVEFTILQMNGEVIVSKEWEMYKR